MKPITVGELKGWLSGLSPDLDNAPVAGIAHAGIPIAMMRVALAVAKDDSGPAVMLECLGHEVCGDWEVVRAFDKNDPLLQLDIHPNRLAHSSLLMFMRGFAYGSATKAFTQEQMADPDWRKGWEAGKAARMEAYGEACMAYNTKLNILRTQQAQHGITPTALALLAMNCPTQYPPGGHEESWVKNPAVQQLSEALKKGGYPYCSKAVLGGKSWPMRIARAGDEIAMKIIEDDASGPEWSWNDEDREENHADSQRN